MEQDKLREEVRKQKQEKNLSFLYFANKLDMNKHSFYNFICGGRELSEEKRNKLKNILNNLNTIKL